MRRLRATRTAGRSSNRPRAWHRPQCSHRFSVLFSCRPRSTLRISHADELHRHPAFAVPFSSVPVVELLPRLLRRPRSGYPVFLSGFRQAHTLRRDWRRKPARQAPGGCVRPYSYLSSNVLPFNTFSQSVNHSTGRRTLEKSSICSASILYVFTNKMSHWQSTSAATETALSRSGWLTLAFCVSPICGSSNLHETCLTSVALLVIVPFYPNDKHQRRASGASDGCNC